MKWKLICCLSLMSALGSLFLAFSSYEEFKEIKMQAESQQVQELAFKKLEIHFLDEINELEKFQQELRTYQSNFPLSPDYAWLRERVQKSKLEFIKYHELKSPSPKLKLLSLSVQGSESQFWDFVKQIHQETPWLRITAFELSTHRNKTLNIRNLQLSWRTDTKDFFNNDSLRVSYSKNWKSYDWNSPKFKSFRDRPLRVISQNKLKPAPLFPQSKSLGKSSVSTPVSSPSFQWPQSWKLEGHVSGRGVSLKIQGKLVFWKLGETLESYKLTAVNNEGITIEKPSGSTVKKSW